MDEDAVTRREFVRHTAAAAAGEAVAGGIMANRPSRPPLSQPMSGRPQLP